MIDQRYPNGSAVSQCAPEPTAQYLDLSALVLRMREDAPLVLVSQPSALAGGMVRTLQRRFRDQIGAGPKWVPTGFRKPRWGWRRTPTSTRPSCPSASVGTTRPTFANDFRGLLASTPADHAHRVRSVVVGVEVRG